MSPVACSTGVLVPPKGYLQKIRAICDRHGLILAEDNCESMGAMLDGRQAAFFPGELPTDPAVLLHPARQGAQAWLDADYAIMNFAPAPLTTRPGDGPPHIRLDRAAEFLIGDRL